MHTQQREQCLEIITFLWMACVKRKNSQQVIKIYVHPMNRGKKNLPNNRIFWMDCGQRKSTQQEIKCCG
jgi:hypothetical protein